MFNMFRVRLLTLLVLIIPTEAWAPFPLIPVRVKDDMAKVLRLILENTYTVDGVSIESSTPAKNGVTKYVLAVEVTRNENEFSLPINKTRAEMCKYQYYSLLCNPAGT